MNSAVVAIDGPAGAGKSTLARQIATELGLPYVNTGSMYRSLTALARERGVDPTDGDALAELASTMEFDLDHRLSPPELRVNGIAPGPELVSPQVEASVSVVSRHPQVRAIMAERQRALGVGGAVMEGRDIGTVIFPDATVKIFLDAAPAARAGRRTLEREGAHDAGAMLAARDALDARTNPLVPARDAVRIDTTGRSARDVFRDAMAVVRDRLGGENHR